MSSFGSSLSLSSVSSGQVELSGLDLLASGADSSAPCPRTNYTCSCSCSTTRKSGMGVNAATELQYGADQREDAAVKDRVQAELWMSLADEIARM
jgi:hypothetical protein